MKAVIKVQFVDDAGEKFFGDGPYVLLRGVEKYGSLRKAAAAMDMAYSKAVKLVKNAETALGYPLTERTTGGKSGGGSRLTSQGSRWLAQYENYRGACIQANQQLYRQFFPETGCVIMASGQGKRFSGNKLMAPFGKDPMIFRILQETEGLFSRRVVVTCHQEVAKLCRDREIPVVLHALPYRSDTVRLGLEALGEVSCCIFCPADQPLLRGETLRRLIACWECDRDRIWRPSCNGVPGAPVLFPQSLLPELRTLPQGKGGGFLLEKYPQMVAYMDVQDPAELLDVDTPEEMQRMIKVKEEAE